MSVPGLSFLRLSPDLGDAPLRAYPGKFVAKRGPLTAQLSEGAMLREVWGEPPEVAVTESPDTGDLSVYAIWPDGHRVVLSVIERPVQRRGSPQPAWFIASACIAHLERVHS